MLKDITFGQYYENKSFVHSIDPRIKILLMIARRLMMMGKIILRRREEILSIIHVIPQLWQHLQPLILK